MPPLGQVTGFIFIFSGCIFVLQVPAVWSYGSAVDASMHE
jgi:hypothetical protein